MRSCKYVLMTILIVAGCGTITTAVLASVGAHAVWIVVIAILSIIPKEDGGLSFKLTESGLLKHFAAYFVGSALFYWAFIKGPPQYDPPD